MWRHPSVAPAINPSIVKGSLFRRLWGESVPNEWWLAWTRTRTSQIRRDSSLRWAQDCPFPTTSSNHPIIPPPPTPPTIFRIQKSFQILPPPTTSNSLQIPLITPPWPPPTSSSSRENYCPLSETSFSLTTTKTLLQCPRKVAYQNGRSSWAWRDPLLMGAARPPITTKTSTPTKAKSPNWPSTITPPPIFP